MVHRALQIDKQKATLLIDHFAMKLSLDALSIEVCATYVPTDNRATDFCRF